MTVTTHTKATVLRIYIGESDRYENKPLYRYLVELFRKNGFSGTTVFRGITGFGETSRISSTAILRLSTDLPVIIEVVETAEKIDAVLPELERIISGGLMTRHEVEILACSGKISVS